MPLLDVFGGAWKDYKKNFKLVLRAYWWLDVFPKVILFGIVGLIFSLLIINSAPGFGASNDMELADTLNSLNPFVLAKDAVANYGDLSLRYSSGFLTAITIIMGVVLLFSFIWLCLTLYYSCFYNWSGDLTFKRAAKGSISYFWKFLGLVLFAILVLLILPVLLLLVIGAIMNYWTILDSAFRILLVVLCVALSIITVIFSIRIVVDWIFAPYVLFKEDAGILESLRKSKEVVRSGWWKVFGCSLLIFVISLLVYWIFSASAYVVGLLISLFYSFTTSLNLVSISIILQAIAAVLAYLIGLAGAIIIFPFVIFFFKNLYFELKRDKGILKKVRISSRKKFRLKRKARNFRKKSTRTKRKSRKKRRDNSEF